MKAKDILLAVAIIILTIFVTFYGLNTLFPKQQFNDFCGEFKTAQIIETPEMCEEIGGKWTFQDIRCITEPCPQGYCDRDFSCREDFEKINELRSRFVFFVALPLGIVIITLGAFFFGLEVVGVGLIGGGVGTLVYGSGAFWPFTQNWVRFLISLAGLVILIWLIYYFNKKFEKKGKRK